MKLDKICEALSEVDELRISLISNCLVGQLLRHVGKSTEEILEQTKVDQTYEDYFDGILPKKYGIFDEQIHEMIKLNDINHSESKKDRHKRVLAHYEGLLIECLISQSSSHHEEDSNRSEDVLIAQ